ncbi:beta-hexosaminidase subunit beta [Capsaspora owczarzaki ATCC 30864]|uniref:Beta-hexosaminidase n=1 Tax=Capsaspora owczarzaki (strain ATCC 30864) TaxID=595528 RepID=A0A0D2WQK1_CAPO3|nr:beta-hexosaminidase subunit beta [Capsaspora owczarzaki ATCC 30864]KJE93970.1 beta-hexosaminidase subunit beta [Capsaspora owczarzaki ATCC 30864]|eukprot:XP_004347426.1 beta-hexosaminidase subunit beta [Capsaspora owczarzaki ATCC 30864]
MRSASAVALLVAAVVALAALPSADAAGQPYIVPLPRRWQYGNSTVYIDSQSFAFTTKTQSFILGEGFNRYRSIIFQHAEARGKTWAPLITGLDVTVESNDDTLQYGIDESYELIIPAQGGPAILRSRNVYGALRGLETFSQIVMFNPVDHVYEVAHAPWNIEDAPRFSHRGLLVDTSRHFEPVPTLKAVIESMSFAKLNVFHWHIVDTQSFPFESRTYPDLWDGTFSLNERYTQEDVMEIVEYAKLFGIRVMPEFDGPGHAASWCTGYPGICPSPSCLEPLDPSSPLTFQVIDGLLSETSGNSRYAGLFPDDMIHFGGDEVDPTCWTQTPRIVNWMNSKNYTTDDAYMYFIETVHSMAIKRGRNPVNWEEVFLHFGSSLDNDTIVHIWLNHDTLAQVVAAGYRGILSNQDVWYLDHLGTTWQQFYLNEPHEGIDDPNQQKLVLGGEVCMWGETVDTSDIFNTVWPRAAAAAERLWSDRQVNSTNLFEPRLLNFRCLLNLRGVPAAPVENAQARTGPPGPGGCYVQ